MKTKGIVLSIFLLTGCGDSNLRCETVAPGSIKLIAEGFEVASGEKPTFGKVAAVKSYKTRPNGEPLYFVSAEIVDSGIATWVMSFVDGSTSIILAMPGLASEITYYPNAKTTSWRFSETDYGFEQSRECLRKGSNPQTSQNH